MSDLVSKVKEKMAEREAQEKEEQKKPVIDNQVDDEVIAASKKSKVPGKGDVAAALPDTTPPPTTPTPAPPTEPSEPSEHTVVSGDNLSLIAKQYLGDANRWRELYEANKTTIGENPSAIRVGMVLKIPR